MSNALLKMAELGLTRAADVLLRNGANLNFEGQLEPRGAGVGRWLKCGPALGGRPSLQALLLLFSWEILPSFMSWVMTKETHIGWPPIPLRAFKWPLTTSDQERVCHCFYHVIALANFPPAPS